MKIIYFFLLTFLFIGCGEKETETTLIETDPTALFSVKCFDNSNNMIYGPAFIITAVKGNVETWELQGSNKEWFTVFGNCIVE